MDENTTTLESRERRRLTQVEVVHAVGHQDVVEEDQTRVVNAFIEPVRSVGSVYIFLCKEPQGWTEGLIQDEAERVLPPSGHFNVEVLACRTFRFLSDQLTVS